MATKMKKRATPTASEPAPEPAAETPPALEGIFGWQPLTLNVETACALCARELSRGAEAFLGLGDDPKRRIFICPGCLPRA